MNLNNKDLDRIFKQKLGQHEVKAPSSAWDHVQRQIFDKKSRRFPWIWVGAGTFVLTVLAAALFLPLDLSGDKGEDGVNVERSEMNPSVGSDPAEDLSQQPFAEEDEAGKEGNRKNGLEERNAGAGGIAPPGQIGREVRTQGVTSASQQEESKHSSVGRKVNISDLASPAAQRNEEEQASPSGERHTSESFPDGERRHGSLPGLNASGPFDAFTRRVLTEEEAAWTDPCQNGLYQYKDDECYSLKSSAPIRFALSWYYGPEFPLRSLTTTDPELSGYADLRNETETYSYAHGLGVRASMKWYSGLKLGTGLHLSKWNERFDYIDEDAEITTTINIIVDTIINSPLDTTYVIDTVSVTKSGTKHYRNTNSYTFFDLPLLIGYEVEGKHMNISINTGVFLHLLFQTDGQVLAADEQPVRYNNRDRTDHSIFKSDIGASLYTSVGFYYKLDKHWDFTFEPSIKYMIEPVTLSSYPLDQRYISFNLYMGMRYRF